VDPSSGAALATRDLLEMLTARGWPCGVFCGPHRDFEHGPPLEQLLRVHELPFERKQATGGSTSFRLYHLLQNGVPVTVYDHPAADSRQPPTVGEGEPFLEVFEQILDRFRPDLVLTFGGHWLAQGVVARAKRRGLPVVFGLHNFAYHDAVMFKELNAVWVPSRFAQEHYQQKLGLNCDAIPYTWDWSRIHCPEVEGRYVTFVNPQPHKGVGVFVRIALELGRRRPDVPLLVVEGRGQVPWLGRMGEDLSSLTNLHRMENTPDPRDFYRVSRLVLMPSLWWESFGRVGAEAMINGIPVLASRRGALPETLAEAGFLFDVPERYKPEAILVPTTEEVEPWVQTILRLWDDAAFYAKEQLRCHAAAEAWRPERVLPRYETFFREVVSGAANVKNCNGLIAGSRPVRC
jgi:glycosyltransferase involved in cell wall biosynthesis